MAFSCSVSHFTCCGLSSSQNQANRPSTTAGIPSKTNSACQSRSPYQPWKWVMIQPASGPLTIPAKIPAMMKIEVIRPRRAAGNQ
ncbi:hypothetical protein D9M71_531970 [compost metagenome]